MATTVDTLITRYQLQDEYTAPANKIAATTEGVGSRITGIAKAVGATMGAALGAGLVGIVKASVEASARYDSLKRGLVAVAGSTEEANAQLTRLKEVAKLPGLGMNEAVEGAINLQAAGLSATMAERALLAFGNALATVGKGKDDLFGVILALSQIQSKGKVSAEEINQLNERVPQIRKAMQAAFGTADTELLGKRGITSEAFISGIVTELLRLKQVTGGTQNSFDNLKDAIDRAFVAGGDVINQKLVPIIDRVTGKIEQMVANGSVEQAFQKGVAFAERFWQTVKGVGEVVKDIFEKFASLPTPIKTAIGYALVLNKLTGGIVTSVVGGMVQNSGLGAALKSAILGPIGMIGTVLIVGAMDLAAKMSKAIDILEMRAEMNAAVPERIGVKDPVTGKTVYHKPSQAEIDAAKLQAKKDFFKRKYGIDVDEATNAINGILKPPTDDTDPNKLKNSDNLAKIAKNTEKMAINFEKFAFGGDLGRMGVTPSEIRRGMTIHAPNGPMMVTDPHGFITEIVAQAMVQLQRA